MENIATLNDAITIYLAFIFHHRETKVMYAVSGGTYNRGNFTLLVNSDGSPMLWED